MECRFILLLQFLKNFLFYSFYFLGVVPNLCVQAFSSCGEQGVLFVSVHRLLNVVASCCRTQVLGAQALVAAAHRLSSW